MGTYESQPQKKRMRLFYQTLMAHKVIKNPLAVKGKENDVIISQLLM